MVDSKFPRDLNTLLSFSHPYIDRFKQRLDSLQPKLWTHLELTPRLDPANGKAVLSFLLELACQSSNMLNIELGRAGLFAIPRDWLLETIEEAAEPLLQLNDDWEYRRLLEVYTELSNAFVRRLALRGLKSTNPEIKKPLKIFWKHSTARTPHDNNLLQRSAASEFMVPPLSVRQRTH